MCDVTRPLQVRDYQKFSKRLCGRVSIRTRYPSAGDNTQGDDDMNSSLVLHCGAFNATYEQLAQVMPPVATDSYEPLPHHEIVDALLETSADVGLTVKRTQFGLNPSGTRMFGVLDFEQSSNPDYSWSVGFRNSHDKSLSAGVCAGSRIFVCDNLAFSGEFSCTKRHIPRNGFLKYIQHSFSSLPEQLENLQKNLDRLKMEGMSEDEARLVIFGAAESGIISSGEVMQIWQEFQEPTFEEFADPTRFNLLMAFTENAKRYNSNAKAEGVYRKLGHLFAI
jgi:hypothetical protein